MGVVSLCSMALIFSLILSLPVVQSFNVLIMMPMGSKSHKNTLDPIAEDLGKRGHQVTIVSCWPETKNPHGVRNVLIQSVADQMKNSNLSFFNSNMGNMLSLSSMRQVHAILCETLKQVYLDPFIQDLIRNPHNRYDIAVVDALFNEFSLPLIHLMNIPIVYMSPTILLPSLAWSLNIPHPYSYVPSMIMLSSDDSMSFWQRTVTTVSNLFMVYMRNQIQLSSFDQIIREFLPNSSSIIDIEKNVSFVLSNSHFSVNPSVPNMPYYANIGGIHCRPAKRLSKDLEDFLGSSGEDGIIFLSFGSIQKGEGMPEDMKEKFLKVFSEIPQKVLWKYEAKIKDLPHNVKLVNWAPQQDILGHPKTKLFISHGGGLSVQEAAYHGVPVLGFPLFAEQVSNIGNVLRLGFGKHLDWQTFSLEDLRESVAQILDDHSYKNNAKRVSLIFRDRPKLPVEVASYWIEYVVKHQGAHHLKSGAEKLNFFQYFLLDIIFVILTVICFIIGFLYVLSKLIFTKFVTLFKDKQIKKFINKVKKS